MGNTASESSEHQLKMCAPSAKLLFWIRDTSRLDFDRLCTAPDGQECWLCDELPAFNRVLNPVGLRLAETEPGKLDLHSFYSGSQLDAMYDGTPTPYCPRFLVMWLSRRHHCVESMTFDRPLPCWQTAVSKRAQQKLSSAGDVGHVRRLSVKGTAKLRDISTVIGSRNQLESLHVSSEETIYDLPAVFLSLLRGASATLKTLQMNVFTICTPSVVLESALECHALQELNLSDGNLSVTWGILAQVLGSVKNVRKIALHLSNEPCETAQLKDAFLDNKSLNEILVRVTCMELCALFCEAVKSSPSVKDLTVIWGPSRAAPFPVIHVAHMLFQSTVLESIRMRNFLLTARECEAVAEGLVENHILQVLDLSDTYVDIEGVAVLTEALCKNNTLRKLNFERFCGTDQDWYSAIRLLVADHCFGRVSMTVWADQHTPVLARSVLCTPGCPRQLKLDVCKLSERSLAHLRDALCGRGTSLRRLVLEITGRLSTPQTDAICSILQDSRSVRTLGIALADRYLIDTIGKFLEPLARNITVTNFELFVELMHEAYARWLALVIGGSESLERVSLHQTDGRYVSYDSWAEIAKGVAKSRTLVEFTARCPLQDSTDFVISETLARNATRLSDASRFVSRKRVGRRYAEAFEMLRAKPSLLDHVEKVSGCSREDAAASIRSATYFLRQNYFLVTGIVRRSLFCLPAAGLTQLDALNADCWQILGGYLRVSDVVAA